MTRYLTGEQVLGLARLALAAPPRLRDRGLLDAAVRRPAASMFGHEAYPHVMVKAAALLHSLAAHSPFARGGRRVAWISTVVFLEYNGVELAAADASAGDLVRAVAAGRYACLDEIAYGLRGLLARV
ncbi:toxin Doc [Sphaerisporangium rufum]|uniref:Toxin Doc n=1 Tax=Sphaerisporangium rufum TaxID=1381558 RepID=A0A919UZ56_9ACTN|nr:Fic family protein [Sphaerisporangium rufum]GII78746.1 toxin Doc [Sphaerisporangium rufum]